MLKTEVANNSGKGIEITLEGEITQETTPQLKELFKNLQFSNALENNEVKLNLKKVYYIASVGVGVLVSLLRTIKENNGNLLLSNLNNDLVELFRITHLDKIFTIQTESNCPG